MKVAITVCAEDLQQERAWVDLLAQLLQDYGEFQILSARESKEYGQIVFIAAAVKKMDALLDKIDRQGRALFLVIDENTPLPQLWKEGRVDDVVTRPFRVLEVLSKLQHYEQLLVWNEVAELNTSMGDLLTKLQEDLRLTERLQKAQLPQRFPDVKGFSVGSRYFAGMRAGGDYFDLAEARDKKHVSWVLTHSTSYSLSRAVLTALMRVTLKLSLDQVGAPGSVVNVVRRIRDELVLTLGEKDRLSLFYGTINRQDRVLRYLNLGDSRLFYARSGSGFISQESVPAILGRSQPGVQDRQNGIEGLESSVALEMGGRLVLLSQGFVEILGGEGKSLELLDQNREKEEKDVLNELAYRLKSKLKADEEMPPQDATVILLDVESHVLRLTKPEQDEN